MKLREIIIQINETLISEAPKIEVESKLNFGDGIVSMGQHFKQQYASRVTTEEGRKDFARMLAKFGHDPIRSQVVDMIPGENQSEFCLFNDRNLGVSIIKIELTIPSTKQVSTTYYCSTIAYNLFPYSHQTLFKVPDEGPCRVFTQEDREQLSPDQARALQPGGRVRPTGSNSLDPNKNYVISKDKQ